MTRGFKTRGLSESGEPWPHRDEDHRCRARTAPPVCGTSPTARRKDQGHPPRARTAQGCPAHVQVLRRQGGEERAGFAGAVITRALSVLRGGDGQGTTARFVEATLPALAPPRAGGAVVSSGPRESSLALNAQRHASWTADWGAVAQGLRCRWLLPATRSWPGMGAPWKHPQKGRSAPSCIPCIPDPSRVRWARELGCVQGSRELPRQWASSARMPLPDVPVGARLSFILRSRVFVQAATSGSK